MLKKKDIRFIALIPNTSNISNKLLVFGALLLLCFSGYAQVTASSIVLSDSDLSVGESAIVTITFSEQIENGSFTNADLTIPNGMLTPVISGDDITFTTTYTPNVGTEAPTNIITIDNTGVTDFLLGNPGVGTTDSANFTIDTLAPTIAIGSPSTGSTSTGPVTYTVTYGGATSVTLVAGDITLNTTGSATGTVGVSGSGTATRTVTISGITGDGTLGISIDPGTATDGLNLAPGAGPSTIFIVDNAVLTLVGTDLLATETGSTNATVTVNLSNAGAVSKTVNLTLAGTTSTVNGEDYTLTGTGVIWGGGTSLTVNFPIGFTARAITITPTDDFLEEGDETVVFTTANGTGYTHGTTSQAVTITDDDNCPTTAPVLNAAISNVFCDIINQDLDAYTNSPAPSNSVLTWSTNADPLVLEGHLAPDILVSSPGTYYGFFYDSINGCASATLPVTLTLNTSPFAGNPVNVSACNISTNGDSIINLDDQIVGADSGGWLSTSGPVGENIIIDPSNEVDFSGQPDGIYTFTYTTTTAVLPCVNISSVLTVTVTDCAGPCNAGTTAPVINSDISTFYCDIIDESLNAYTDSMAPAGTTLTWSTLSDPLNTNAHLTDAQVANPGNDGSYFAFFYDAVNACASPTLEVEITLNTIPVITATTDDGTCGPGDVILTVTGNTPGSIEPPTFNWYDSETGGNLLVLGSDSVAFTISATTTYYVEAEANGCISDRVEVLATLYPLPSAGIPTNAFACNVSLNGPTIADLDDLITGESVGEWSVTTDLSGTLSIGVGNIVNFENRANGDYIFTYTTSDATPPFCENVSSEITITVNDCDVDSDLDGLLDGLEITLGTDLNNVDTDGDGLEDAVEVGSDVENPIDEDLDGIIDALDSNTFDSDMDGVVDQLDPANMNPCIPDPTSEFCVATVDLEITKTTDDDFLNVNEQLTFTITVTNNSDLSASLIQVDEVLDEVGFDYISHFAGPGDGVYDEVTGLWDIPMLAPNESATLVILAEAISYGVYVNTVTILGSSPVDIDLENNEASVEIEVNERSNNECGFLFNQFSPNGDGTNDYLVINCITIPEYANNSLEIYDRYGNQVFEAKGYDNTWAGTRNNNDLPKGTYFYVLDLGDGSEIRKGWIQIIR